GVKEVTEGISFSLSLPLDYPRGEGVTEGRDGPRLSSTPLGHNCQFLPGFRDIGCDDMVTLTLQYSTQWDALSHMGAMFDADDDGEPEIRYYNGFRGGEDVVGTPDGKQAPCSRSLGIEN